MKYCINSKTLKDNNLSLYEFLFLWLCASDKNITQLKESLIDKGILDDMYSKSTGLPSLNIDLKNKIADLLIDNSSTENTSKDFYETVAEKMREYFPAGKKQGTSYMWRDSIPVIARRLKLLHVKYGYKFTEEQVLKATEAYVRSFNGDYRYMQLLKYFILKVPVNANGDVEVRSELMSYIENEGQEDINNAWLNELK